MLTETDVPDGGWGWVIVACSFLIHMLVVGTVYSLSVVYVAWLEYFGGGKGVTSWIISLAVAVMFAIGPLPGVLSKRLGNRGVVILGSIIMSSGFAVSCFAMNVYFLVVSIGIVTGAGAGCSYLPSISMIAMYFSKKRSVAMGIAASGVGVGTFCMAPLLNWLVDFYGWRGCMLILSGISLNVCVLGALMRPLRKSKIIKAKTEIHDRAINFSSGPETSLLNEKCNTFDMGIADFNNHNYHWQHNNCSGIRICNDNYIYHQLSTSEAVIPDQHVDISIPSILIHHCDDLNKSLEKNNQSGYDSCHKTQLTDFSPGVLQQSSKQICNSKENYSKAFSSLISLSETNIHKKTSNLNKDCHTRIGRSMEILNTSKQKHFPGGKLYSSEMEIYSKRKLLPLSSPVSNKIASLSNKQIMLAGSIATLLYLEKTSTTKSNTSIHSNCNIIIPPSSSEVDRCATQVSSSYPRIAKHTDDHEESHETQPGTLFHKYIYLLKDGPFMLFGVSNFLTNVSFFMPVLYMVDRALNSGINITVATLLVSLYGVGNIFGKLFFGWLADRKLVDRSFYYIGCITFCGTATSFSPLCGSSHELHSIYAFTFGCFIGAYVTLFPLVTIDLVGISLVTESFALLLCFMGVATAFGTPLAGLIFDWTGSYTISFVLHGVILLVSGFMLIPLIVLKRKQTFTTII